MFQAWLELPGQSRGLANTISLPSDKLQQLLSASLLDNKKGSGGSLMNIRGMHLIPCLSHKGDVGVIAPWLKKSVNVLFQLMHVFSI